MTTQLWLPAKADRFTKGRGAIVDTIVYHTTTTTFDAAIATFQGGSRLVSAHYVIDRDVDRIGACVREDDTAWHAGNWPVNQRSIGIEGVDNGDWWGPRPDAFYDREIDLSLAIMGRYLITRWLRHNECSATACPDGLDTGRIIAAVGGPEVPTQAEWDQHIKDEAATFDAIKALLNPIAAWVYDAPNRQLSTKGRADFKKALRILDEAAARTPKRAKRATRAQVLAGHGRG